ncbi:unnamed protein product [Mytilus coruscus]|uniref:Uncharacterized protein n=1 Tax=Mytilus coruscus TaxID=42192 RepID=A0A6J8A4C1_MYTCO|nr:unnamed protein product [Mytilus coruscus]
MEKFFEIYNIKELHAWYKWWHDRRSHIFRAFKMENSPSSNLAEVGHAKIASNSGINISLLEAARVDVASAIRQATDIRLFHSGISKGGKEPNTYQKEFKNKYKTEPHARCNSKTLFIAETGAPRTNADSAAYFKDESPHDKHRFRSTFQAIINYCLSVWIGVYNGHWS